MTDNKTIIDGVDVSECVSFDKRNGKNLCCCDDTRDDKIPFANFCVENKNCYFKQLARAKRELEKIKEISKEYKVEYTVNNGVQILTNKILQIIEGEENE